MEINNIYPVILTLIMVGILLGVGLITLAELRENIATEVTGTDNNVNLTATMSTNQTTLTDASKDDYYLVSVDSVINGTTTISSSLYSVTSGGIITWDDDLVINNEGLLFVNVSSTYYYDQANSPESAVNDTLEGIGGFADWIAVIVVVIAAAIILGIVLRSFGASTEV